MVKKTMVWCVLVLGIGACGGGGGSPVTPSTPAPSRAAITATGAGALEVHPSKFTAWCCALVVPIKITEIGGGKADWTFARLSLFLNGVEIERSEIGSDILKQPPDVTKIEPNSSLTINLTFRQNSTRFDRVDITLGFNDRLFVGQAFTVLVPFGSFSGVTTVLTPLSVPRGGLARRF
jgi:hypothetical protein